MFVRSLDAAPGLASATLGLLGAVGFGLLFESVAGGLAGGCALFVVVRSLHRLSRTWTRERYDPEFGIVRGYNSERRITSRGFRRLAGSSALRRRA